MDKWNHAISLTARNMYAAWAWCKPTIWDTYWHRLANNQFSIISYVTDGQRLMREVRFPVRVYRVS